MAVSNGGINSDKGLVKLEGSIAGTEGYRQVTFKEVSLTESLLTPGLQTSAVFQSQIYGNTPFKDWSVAKNAALNLTMSDSFGQSMTVRQKVYRLDNREFQPVNVSNVEEMTFHACDDSLLEDAKTLVSKSWKCATPNQIVDYVLTSCLSVQGSDIQSCRPTKDYVADSIHPFQVINQQCNMALDGDDPSFIHYMTYGVGNNSQPTHHFRSLKNLTNGNPVARFVYTVSGVRGQTDYNNPNRRDTVINFMFPCDFDYLSDLLNGVGASGENLNSILTINPTNAQGSYENGTINPCIKNGNLKISLTNKGTAQKKGGCESDVEKYLLRRQARMGLLEKDKIALRLIVPWRPSLHAGDVISFTWQDKLNGAPLYGSGDYLISSMTHRIQMGGYGTTTLDCVSRDVGVGIV